MEDLELVVVVVDSHAPGASARRQKRDQRGASSSFPTSIFPLAQLTMASYENDPFYLRYEDNASACAVSAHAAMT